MLSFLTSKRPIEFVTSIVHHDFIPVDEFVNICKISCIRTVTPASCLLADISHG
jgi:hypothetical protein